MNWRLWVALSRLDRTAWSPPARLREFQAGRLRLLVRHAYAQSPYYREAMASRGFSPRDIRTLDDLQRLPVISREEILRHESEFVARNAARFLPHKDATGGTTGAPLEFLVDRDAITIASAVRRRFLGWHGLRPGDRLAEFRRPQSFRLPTGEPDYQTLSRFYPRQNLLRFNLRAIRSDRFSEIAAELVRFRPAAIQTIPTILVALSLYLLNHREYVIRPGAIFAGGERLFPEAREIFSRAFSAPVFETYGNRELALMGGECERGRLHLAAELSIMEILKDGRPCPPGDLGEVVATNLWNRSFPFLRYAIGDVATAEAEPCPCGRGLPTARILGGKVLNLLATPHGFVVPSNSIVATPRWRGKVAGIRLYQERREAVTAQVVRGPGYADADEAALVADLEGAFGGALRVTVEYYDTLEETPGGKYRFVVSTVPVTL